MCPICKNLLVPYPITCPSFQADVRSDLNLLTLALARGGPLEPVKAPYLRLPQVCPGASFITPLDYSSSWELEKSPVLAGELGHETH